MTSFLMPVITNSIKQKKIWLALKNKTFGVNSNISVTTAASASKFIHHGRTINWTFATTRKDKKNSSLDVILSTNKHTATAKSRTNFYELLHPPCGYDLDAAKRTLEHHKRRANFMNSGTTPLKPRNADIINL